MRKLKFRMWDEKYNCWINDPVFIYPTTDIVKQGIVFQQFTGLKDKNGKEIYEGDYINFSYSGSKTFQGFVRWFNDRGSFGVTVDNAFETFEELMDYWSSVEVVGNIFQQKSCMDELAEIAQKHGLY
jgi:uncharacterized phage protein (TIGR01671 family)